MAAGEAAEKYERGDRLIKSRHVKYIIPDAGKDRFRPQLHASFGEGSRISAQGSRELTAAEGEL